MSRFDWKEIKKKGNPQYKGDVELIDLFRSGDVLWDGIIFSIMRYAWRNRRQIKPDGIEYVNPNDIKKMIHYAEMLQFLQRNAVEDTWNEVLNKMDQFPEDDSPAAHEAERPEDRDNVEKTRLVPDPTPEDGKQPDPEEDKDPGYAPLHFDPQFGKPTDHSD